MKHPKKLKIVTRYINTFVILKKSQYEDGSIAIVAVSEEGEPEFTATVRLGSKPAEGRVWLKGWSENEGIPEALEMAGVVKLTGNSVPTGYTSADEAILLDSEYLPL